MDTDKRTPSSSVLIRVHLWLKEFSRAATSSGETDGQGSLRYADRRRALAVAQAIEPALHPAAFEERLATKDELDQRNGHE
jgi:hypothetical protein